jgi:GNAT superfamily N-acetyltransferase
MARGALSPDPMADAGPSESTEPAGGAEADASGESGAEPSRRGRGFGTLLLLAVLLHRAVAWVLEALPCRRGESLVLRWLRSWADHPVRGPLGVALLVLALVELGRALSNRPPRA